MEKRIYSLKMFKVTIISAVNHTEKLKPFDAFNIKLTQFFLSDLFSVSKIFNIYRFKGPQGSQDAPILNGAINLTDVSSQWFGMFDSWQRSLIQ